MMSTDSNLMSHQNLFLLIRIFALQDFNSSILQTVLEYNLGDHEDKSSRIKALPMLRLTLNYIKVMFPVLPHKQNRMQKQMK